jgi:hypothetical protein
MAVQVAAWVGIRGPPALHVTLEAASFAAINHFSTGLVREVCQYIQKITKMKTPPPEDPRVDVHEITGK